MAAVTSKDLNETGIIDSDYNYCYLRSVGYDLACFVKSKEAGQRITDMINEINEKDETKQFDCWLDYRENEPHWIQVKIQYRDSLRAEILSQLIRENNNIITEKQIEDAINKKIDFETYWKYHAKYYFYNPIEFEFVKSIISMPNELSNEDKKNAFKHTHGNNNYLDQFECLGTYIQIENELLNGNINTAVSLAKNLICARDDFFDVNIELNRPQNDECYASIRKVLNKELVNNVNIYYNDKKQINDMTVPKNYYEYMFWENDYHKYKFWEIDDRFNITDEQINNFKTDWNEIVPYIFNAIDLETLKTAADIETIKDVKSKKEVFDKHPNIYQMASLFGLYVQVEKLLQEEKYDTAIFAIKHVSSKINTQFALQSNEQNDIREVYTKINDLSVKYFDNNFNYDQDNNSKVLKKEK